MNTSTSSQMLLSSCRLPLLQRTIDILQVLSSTDMEVCRKAMSIVLSMTLNPNIEEVVLFLKKQLQQIQEHEFEKATSNPIDPHVSSQASEVACLSTASNIMLSPLYESIPKLDIDSDFNNRDPDDVDHISIPGPSASKGEILETLKALHVQMQRLSEENQSIKEENKTLYTQHELSVHEDTITIYTCKYGMMVEIFPSSELLNKKLLESPTPFAMQDSAFLDKLYHHFPESLHKVMETLYFSDLVLKCISNTCANEIKKLCGIAGNIFNLPLKYYFTNINFERAAIPEIQQLLGVMSAMDLAYRIFLSILFPGLKDDKSLKTVFGNWELLAWILKALLCGITSLQGLSSSSAHTNSLKWSVCQVTLGSIAWAAVIAIFLISPDTEFLSTGIGKKSNINYKNLFFHYKKILVTKWTMKCIIAIVTNINQYIFKVAKALALKCAERKDDTDAINCALAALDMDSNSGNDSGNESDASVQIATALEAADPVNGPDTVDLEGAVLADADVDMDVGMGKGELEGRRQPLCQW
ncbi:hypothetical protein BDR06DRAFT_1050533 [Suillus hirtellus]|nr:hypothetical protein BDR06DRAFT_1050533 [Suillus hirtellus]